jgi:hypothetical protein
LKTHASVHVHNSVNLTSRPKVSLISCTNRVDTHGATASLLLRESPLHMYRSNKLHIIYEAGRLWGRSRGYKIFRRDSHRDPGDADPEWTWADSSEPAEHHNSLLIVMRSTSVPITQCAVVITFPRCKSSAEPRMVTTRSRKDD